MRPFASSMSPSHRCHHEGGVRIIWVVLVSPVVALVLGSATAVNAQTITNWEFSACPEDVEEFFADTFPEYKTRVRRLRALLEAEGEMGSRPSMESLLFSRAKRKLFGGATGRGGRSRQSSVDQTTAAASSEGSQEESLDSVMTGIMNRIPLPLPTMGYYVPPPEAWDSARMAASGCTSCANACCDAIDIDLDCGVMEVPLDYSNATGPKIRLSVYRVRLMTPQLVPPTRSHLWVLQGGPGMSGLSILSAAVPALQFATDIYVPDHRGTGLSNELNCRDQQSPSSDEGSNLSPVEVQSCYDYSTNVLGVDFKKFTVTAAARDLEKMISSAKSLFAPAAVYVHGYSYGTRWAQRFLQLFPNAVDKVVLEGVVAKDTVFNDFAIGSQTAGERFMNKCLVNSKCSQFFS